VASIRKTGSKTWTVFWREGGRGRAGTSRQRSFNKFGVADAFRKDREDDEDRRGTGQPGGSGKWSLERFFTDKFLPLRSPQVTGGTRGTWTKRWAPTVAAPSPWHLKRAFGSWALEDINYEAVLGWHARMHKAGASDSQVAMAHDLLVNILNFAVKLHYIQPSFWGERPRYQPARVTGLWRPDTIEFLREHLLTIAADGRRRDQRWLADRDAVLIAVLAYAAPRPGEALALTWQQVLAEHLWITHTIPGLDDDEPRTPEDGRTKTKLDRVVPFKQAPFLRAILREWKLRVGPHDETTPVFPTELGGRECWPYHAYLSWRSKRWKPLLQSAGHEYRRPYHLRHSCITMWIYQGMPLPEVAKRAGHSQQTCLARYSHAWETLPERPFNMAEAFAEARLQATGQRRSGGLSIVRGARDQA
jgi:integrase